MEISKFLVVLLQKSQVNENGCHLWGGAVDVSGYGVVSLPEGKRRAHRVSYSLFNGEIPDGMMILHSCDTPRCVNPNHLRVGTAKENAMDMFSRSRQAKGESCGASKLKEKEVLEIYHSSENHADIARFYGIDKKLVTLIKRGAVWKQLFKEEGISPKYKKRDSSKNMPIPKSNTSGVCGVKWDKSRMKWMAAIVVNKKSKTLGRFDNFEDACRCRQEALEYYGFDKNHGKRNVKNGN